MSDRQQVYRCRNENLSMHGVFAADSLGLFFRAIAPYTLQNNQMRLPLARLPTSDGVVIYVENLRRIGTPSSTLQEWVAQVIKAQPQENSPYRLVVSEEVLRPKFDYEPAPGISLKLSYQETTGSWIISAEFTPTIPNRQVRVAIYEKICAHIRPESYRPSQRASHPAEVWWLPTWSLAIFRRYINQDPEVL